MPGNYGWLDASEVALSDLREQVTAWRRAHSQIAAKFAAVEEREKRLEAVALAWKADIEGELNGTLHQPGRCDVGDRYNRERLERIDAALATPANAGERK
jgi:hypothetical protein